MPQAAIERFAKLLATEVEETRRLTEALESAQDVFAGNDPAAIEATAASIHQLNDAVEALETKRQQAVAAAGLSADRDGMEQLVNKFDKEGVIAPLWNELLELAGRCRTQNEINARIIESSRHHAEAAFALLRGKGPGEETYSAEGRAAPTGGSRPIAKA